jgi:general secretion pathway protein E
LTAADLDADPRYGALGFRADDVLYEPGGCERCNGAGYRGRIGIFEILEINNEVRALVDEKTDGSVIDEVAIRGGMTTMIQDGVAKCHAGATSAAEILRVTTVR